MMEVMADREDTERNVWCGVHIQATGHVARAVHDHLVTCQECAPNVSECPVCRKHHCKRIANVANIIVNVALYTSL